MPAIARRHLDLHKGIKYIGFWETLSNPAFNVREFEYIRNEIGTNCIVMTAKEWIEARTKLAVV